MDASRRGKGPAARPPQVWGRRRGRARAPGPLLGRRRCLRLFHKLSRPLAAEEALLAGSPGALVGSEFITSAPGGPVPLKSGSEADLPEPRIKSPLTRPLHLGVIGVSFGLFISNVVVKPPMSWSS